MKPLRVLITNISFSGRTGTETYTRDLALALHSLGHEPAVYSPRPGKLANELNSAGIQVSADLPSFTPPDIIHGHHNLPLALAMLRFPAVPAVFVCHDAKAWHDAPPRFARIQHYVAVDFLCRDRLKAEGIPEERISIIGNSVDLQRFRQRGPLPMRPKRALLFNNYASESTLAIVREACRNSGLELDVCGYGVGNVSENPEAILPDYDLVFAKARCAMEAMACGSAVILCGSEGAGPLVTCDRFDYFRNYNFGRHLLQEPLTAEYLAVQIGRYDPADAQQVSGVARANLELDAMTQKWLELYRTIQPPVKQQDESEEIMQFLLSLEASLFHLTELEGQLAWLQAKLARFEAQHAWLQAKVAWLEAARQSQESEIQYLRRKAIKLRGPLKRLWNFPSARPLLRLLGLRALTEERMPTSSTARVATTG